MVVAALGRADWFACGLWVALGLLAVPGLARAQFTLDVIAYRGQQAPEQVAGVTFDTLGSGPRLNAAGEACFNVQLAGPGIANGNESAIYRASPGGVLSLVVQRFDPVPGMPGVLFSSASPPSLDENGGVIVPIDLFESPFGLRDSIWRFDRFGAGTPLAVEGDPAPGAPGEVYTQFFSALAVNGAGEIGFENDGRIFGPDGLTPLTRLVAEGDPAPGTSPGTIFFRILGPAVQGLSDGGRLGFLAELSGGGVTAADREGIWVQDGAGGLDLHLRLGDPVPGAAAGVVVADLTLPQVRDAGIAVQSDLSGPGVTLDNDELFWGPDGAGNPVPFARTGDSPPDLAGAAVFEGLSGTLNDVGQVALFGRLTGPGVTDANDAGIWLYQPGGSGEKIWRESGQILPGLGLIELRSTARFNDRGDLAVAAILAGSQIGGEKLGILFRAADSGPTVVVLEGDTLEVAPGDVRTIASLQPRSMSESGALSIVAIFEDGSEAFVVARPPTPVPSISAFSVAALAIVLIAVAFRAARLGLSRRAARPKLGLR